ncbi:MAG: aspartate ammonia-lyase, partial [Marinobacter sp.]|nr:aspartate ammonia-lyase [Marinobacter sp.]
NLLNSMKMLGAACKMLDEKCIKGILANTDQCARHLDNSIGIITALVPRLGYSNATRIASMALNSGSTVRELVLEEGLLEASELDRLLSPRAMLAPVGDDA